MENFRREIREKYKVLFESSLGYIFVYNMEGKIIDANDMILKALGYSIEEVINQSFGNYIPKEEILQSARVIRELRKTGKITKSNIYHVKKKDGNQINLEIYGIPLKKEDKVEAVIAIAHDVTEKLLTEEKLKQSEKKYRSLVNNVNDIIVEIDLNGKITYLSPQIYNILGYKEEELVGTNGFNLVHPDDVSYVKNTIENAIKSKEIFTYDHRVKSKSGDYVFISAKGALVDIDRELRITGILRDVSEQKKAELALKESKHKYKHLFNNSPFSIVLINLEGIIENINLTTENFLGFKREEVIGKNFLDLPIYLSEMVPILKKRLNLYSIGKKLKSIELKLFKKDGSFVWVNPYVSLIDIAGKNRIQIIFEDITNRVEAEGKLKKSEKMYKEAFEVENFYKDLFTHDTRNILQSMFASIELCEFNLESIENNKTIKNLLENLKEQVHRGANLVKNVRKFSQLKDTDLKLKRINAKEVLDKTITLIENYKNTKQIKISIDTSVENYIVQADEFLLDVFENILINAIIHNNSDIIEVLIKIYTSKYMKKEFLNFEFIDNGEGIPDYKRESIFKRVKKEDRSVSGMGLGLSLVKIILDRYKAQIRIENKIEDDFTKGSKFILLFPIN